MLHTEHQNVHSPWKVRTFLGSENILAGPPLPYSVWELGPGFKVWLRIRFGFELARGLASMGRHRIPHYGYLSPNRNSTRMCAFVCVCVCVYWPWPAAPAGAPWWPQGSCPAGSAARKQSEPTSLLCPFLLAATHTPGIHTYAATQTDKHTHAHKTKGICTHLTWVHTKEINGQTHTHTHTHTHTQTSTQDRERMAELVGLGSHS